MKIKCDWCGSWINDFDQVCPNCGGVNNNYNRHANGVPQTIEELKKQRFVTQREGCDADVNHVMNKYDLPGGGGSYIADDMSAVSLVMGGFGVCLMPELVIRNIPFPVDVIPLEVEEKRTIVLAYVRSDVLAPAVQKMQSYILESFQKKAEEEQ